MVLFFVTDALHSTASAATTVVVLAFTFPVSACIPFMAGSNNEHFPGENLLPTAVSLIIHHVELGLELELSPEAVSCLGSCEHCV